MEDNLLTIGQAADYLGVSLMTLRRWDESKKLIAIRKNGGTHRYYRERDLELIANDLVKLANDWVQEKADFPRMYYCQNTAIFQARLIRFETELMKKDGFEELFSLIVAVVGEIGNNSFDHNIGKWPDEPGIFFGYDLKKGIVVLADRGLGVLKTLRQVRPSLSNHTQALDVAFNEIISGRSPEKRGNGLKYVRDVVKQYPINLFFTSGDAELRLKDPEKNLLITRSGILTQGCFATIEFNRNSHK
ncbi:helix-turn-helix domain-containing protein [Patescibacteria group bacterium]|nr:helix-turn-helix domain-containing protein [Patescibacteria group bacterium]